MEYHRGQPVPVSLGQFPGFCCHYILVDLTDYLPDGHEGLMKTQSGHEVGIGIDNS